jgi:hypothetical protein
MVPEKSMLPGVGDPVPTANVWQVIAVQFPVRKTVPVESTVKDVAGRIGEAHERRGLSVCSNDTAGNRYQCNCQYSFRDACKVHGLPFLFVVQKPSMILSKSGFGFAPESIGANVQRER